MTPMMQMWGMFALLFLVACLFVVAPFIRRQKLVSVDHDANAERIEIYHQRLEELQYELKNKRIEQTSYEESIVELKSRLLNELSPEKTLDTKGNNRILAITGVAFMVVVSGVFYHYTGSQNQIQNWYSAIDKLPEYGERAVMQQGEPLSQNELQAFALGLRTKLATDGDDAVAWMLLGRVAMTLNDYEMAMQAFDEALEMQPENVNVLVNYSQALLIEGSESSINRAAKKLSKVLKLAPTNMDAISLLALIAYERQDWLESKAAFEMLQSSMASDDPRYNMISGRIQELERKVAEIQSAAEGPTITISVEISPDIAHLVPKDSTLFVFAKAENGPGMPLAVEKITNFNLPIKVSLDDSKAMMPDLKLSNFDRVELTARISTDESVMPQEGELEGNLPAFNIKSGDSLNKTIIISDVLTSTGS